MYHTNKYNIVLVNTRLAKKKQKKKQQQQTNMNYITDNVISIKQTFLIFNKKQQLYNISKMYSKVLCGGDP